MCECQKCMIGGGMIPERDKDYLIASEEAYIPRDNRQNAGRFVYDHSLSTDRTAVYHSPTELLIAHRGTVPSSSEDLAADALIVAGKFDKSERLKQALKVIEAAMKKYPNRKLIGTGHSLGGKVAQAIALMMSVPNSRAIVFNPGASPLEIARNIKDLAVCKFTNSDKCKKLKNLTVYSTAVDPISISSLLHAGKTHVIKAEGANVHSLGNFR